MYSSTCLVRTPLGTSNTVPALQVSPHQGDRKFRQHFWNIFTIFIYTHSTYINIIFTSTLPICINIQVTHIILKLPNYVPIFVSTLPIHYIILTFKLPILYLNYSRHALYLYLYPNYPTCAENKSLMDFCLPTAV